MGFLGNIIKNAIGNGISSGINKGISNAVSSAAEKIVAPKVDAYANSVANSLDEATQSLDEAAKAQNESGQTADGQSGTSSLEQSLNRLSQSAERYAKAVEAKQAGETAGLDKWEELLPGFPVWPFGGKDFSIEVRYVDEPTGSLFYDFCAVGATYEELEKYVQILKNEGFVQKYKGADATLYKDLGNGEYLGFGSTEAFNDLDVMCIALGRTRSVNEV